jgi:hypothetical protein
MWMQQYLIWAPLWLQASRLPGRPLLPQGGPLEGPPWRPHPALRPALQVCLTTRNRTYVDELRALIHCGQFLCDRCTDRGS